MWGTSTEGQRSWKCTLYFRQWLTSLVASHVMQPVSSRQIWGENEPGSRMLCPSFVSEQFSQRFAAEHGRRHTLTSTFLYEIFQTCWWVTMDPTAPCHWFNQKPVSTWYLVSFGWSTASVGCPNVALMSVMFCVSHGYFRGCSCYTFQLWLPQLLIFSALPQWSAYIVVF